MNFLELCRDVARESGTLAGGAQAISSVNSPGSGRGEKIVNWVREAWKAIQLEHNDWSFMRREFEHSVTPGKARYSASDLSIARFGLWIVEDEWDFPFTIQDSTKDRSDESGIAAIPFGLWRARYGRGVVDANRPTEFAITPLSEVALGASPDRMYVLRGMYVVAPQVLSLDLDVPEMPPQYHRAITWRALQLLATADEATFSLQTSVGEFSLVRNAMSRDLRPRAEIAWDSSTVIA